MTATFYKEVGKRYAKIDTDSEILYLSAEEAWDDFAESELKNGENLAEMRASFILGFEFERRCDENILRANAEFFLAEAGGDHSWGCEDLRDDELLKMSREVLELRMERLAIEEFENWVAKGDALGKLAAAKGWSWFKPYTDYKEFLGHALIRRGVLLQGKLHDAFIKDDSYQWLEKEVLDFSEWETASGAPDALQPVAEELRLKMFLSDGINVTPQEFRAYSDRELAEAWLREEYYRRGRRRELDTDDVLKMAAILISDALSSEFAGVDEANKAALVDELTMIYRGSLSRLCEEFGIHRLDSNAACETFALWLKENLSA